MLYTCFRLSARAAAGWLLAGSEPQSAAAAASASAASAAAPPSDNKELPLHASARVLSCRLAHGPACTLISTGPHSLGLSCLLSSEIKLTELSSTAVPDFASTQAQLLVVNSNLLRTVAALAQCLGDYAKVQESPSSAAATTSNPVVMFTLAKSKVTALCVELLQTLPEKKSLGNS
jgi:hypothetical protein